MTAVELAWISPTIRNGGKPYDRENYVDLIRVSNFILRGTISVTSFCDSVTFKRG